MHQLFEIQALLLKQFEQIVIYQREIFKTFQFDNRLNCIIGARGIGKTTFLLKHIAKHALEGTALYVSADNMFFLTNTLTSLVDTLYKETHVRLLCIDEIHKQPHWQQQLKNITLDFSQLSSQGQLINQ